MAVPPPPPPFPALKSQTEEAGYSRHVKEHHEYFREALQLEEEVDSLVEFLQKDFSKETHHSDGHATTNNSRPTVITSVKRVTPVIQNGPMCGLAALSMASEILSKDSSRVDEGNARHPENLLRYAQTHNLSKEGEMFSVAYMQEIAEHHLHYSTSILNIETFSVKDLLSTLLSDNHAIVVPYDADKNHSPCQARGHKAHWCLLVGFAIVIQETKAGPDEIGALQWCKQSTRQSGHYCVKKEDGESFLSAFSHWEGGFDRVLEEDRLYVFARHGKSARMGLWSYSDLVSSCQNLVEVDPKRINPEDYVIPHGGIQEGLKSKFLLITSDVIHKKFEKPNSYN